MKNTNYSHIRIYAFPTTFFLFFFFHENLCAQDSVNVNKDSVTVKIAPVANDTSSGDSVSKPVAPPKRIVHIKKDSSSKKDSVLLLAADSNRNKKNLLTNADTNTAHNPVDLVATGNSTTLARFKLILASNAYYNFMGLAVRERMQIHKAVSYDMVFYLLVGVLFYFAIVKVLFGKYMGNLFTLFFTVSMRQQQIREQVLQSPFPSLLLNIFFIIVGGLYGTFLVQYYHLAPTANFWVLFIDFGAVICGIYLLKFLLLKSVGWIFNIQRATDTYIFIVFLTNKMLGIFLMPFIIILSFSGTLLSEVAVTLSLLIVLIFFVYRFIAAYPPLRKEIKMNGFHFFLYLCAFEIAPLLLIYKVLLSYLEKAY